MSCTFRTDSFPARKGGNPLGFGHHFGANLLLPLIPHGMNPPRLPSVIRKTNQGLSTSVPGQPRGKLSLGQGGWEKFVGLSQRPVLALGIISLWGNKQCWITALHTDIFRMLTTSRSFFFCIRFFTQVQDIDRK